MIWAGAVMIWAGAVMIWAGAVMIWAGACSNTNFSTLKIPKNAKKQKCDGRTDGPTDTVAYSSRVCDRNSLRYTCNGRRVKGKGERKERKTNRPTHCGLKNKKIRIKI